MINRARGRRGMFGMAFGAACIGGLLWSRWGAPANTGEPARARDQAPRESPRRAAPRSSGQRGPSLSSLSTLAGVVQTSSRQRLPGARVCVGSDDGFDAADCPITDARGEFRLSSRRQAGRVWASARGHALGSQAFSFAQPGAHLDVTLVLQPAEVSVSGTLVDAMGGVIAGGVVSALPSTSAAPLASDVTDAAGRFSLDSPRAAFRLMAAAEGYSTTVQPARGPAEGLVVALAPAASIVGRAIFAGTTDPAPGLTVTAIGRGGPQDRATGQTQPDGSFELAGLASGGYALIAKSERWSSPERWMNIAPGRVSESLLLEVTGAVTLSGSILVDDEPCTDGRLMLSGPAPMVLSTDGEGALYAEGLVPGAYSAEARCGFALPHTEVIEVANTPVERRWNLSAGSSLSGLVTTWSGAPLPDARIAVEPVLRGDESPEARGQRSQCVSDAAGRFTCIGLRAGEHRAALVDRASEPALVTLASGASPQVTLRAAAQAAIRAQLGEAPAEHAMVFARNEARQIVLGERRGGEFFFERLPLGRYSVVAGSPGVDESDAERVTLDRDGDTRTVVLRATASAELTGQVVDDQNQPVMDAWVSASPAESQLRISTPLPAVLTDDRGAFSISGLSRAPYDLSVSSPEGEGVARDVRAGEAGVTVRLERASAPE